MAEAKYFCPMCGSPEIQVQGTPLEIKLRNTLKGLDAHCELCGWSGVVEDLIGAVSQETFYDIDKISAILIGVVAKHAAGPLVQALELIGLLEKGDQPGRDHVMRNISAATITVAFQSAATWAAARKDAMENPEVADEGEKNCPYCNEDFVYPYIHTCPGKNAIVEQGNFDIPKEGANGND